MLPELQTHFADSEQVKRLGLQGATDLSIWQYAGDHDFIIVTQDSDFHELSLLHGIPPKIIWLKCGNKPRWYLRRL